MRKLMISFCVSCIFSLCSFAAIAQSSGSDYLSMIDGWKADGSSLKGSQKNQFGFGFPEIFTNYSLVKVYVPAGTTEFSVTGSLPQQTPYAVVSRFGKPPATTSLTGTIGSGQYGDINREFSQGKAFAKLLAGEEMIQVHDGGGSMGYAGVARLNSRPLVKGKWLYMRVLIGSEGGIRSFQGGGETDLPMYMEGMVGVRFQTVGNGLPIEDNTSPVRPSGIIIEPSTVLPGGNATIRPREVDAIALGRCEIDPTSPLGAHVTLVNYKIAVSTAAPVGTVKIQCGDATDFSSDTAFLNPVFTFNLTVGTPVPLAGIKLSDDFINALNSVPIAVQPVPTAASLGTCDLSGSGAEYTSFSNGSISIKTGADITKITSELNAVINCSGVVSQFKVKPVPLLVLMPAALVQGSGVVQITKSDQTSASSCMLQRTSSSTVDPNEYLDITGNSISFKPGKVLPQTPASQTVSVTCDGVLTAELVLIPAPLGVLFALHNNEPGSGVVPSPTSRDESKVVLVWREADASGKTVYNPLLGKYPSFPSTTTSENEFVCVEVDGNDTKISPARLLFVPAGVSAPPMMELTTVAASVVAQTKILCYVAGKAAGSNTIEGSKKRLTLNISNGKWSLAVPTEANPIIDVSTSAGNAELLVHIPKADNPQDEVRVFVQLYSTTNDVLPVFFATPNRNLPLQLLPFDADLTEKDLVYVTVPANHADRIISLDLLYPKSVYASSDIKAKANIWYRHGKGFLQIKSLSKDWNASLAN